jgi:hypothetical protein
MIDVPDNNSVYYYHFDGLGSVIALSNSNREIIESYSYDVFGAVTIRDANNSVSFYEARPVKLKNLSDWFKGACRVCR